MWARVMEVMIGIWLALSPFIFQHASHQKALWANDLLCALAVVALALGSFWDRLRHLHLLICGVALWLIGFGYLGSSHPAPPAFQNDLLIGLLLLMSGIIPNEASLPPVSWRKFYSKKSPARADAHRVSIFDF